MGPTIQFRCSQKGWVFHHISRSPQSICSWSRTLYCDTSIFSSSDSDQSLGHGEDDIEPTCNSPGVITISQVRLWTLLAPSICVFSVWSLWLSPSISLSTGVIAVCALWLSQLVAHSIGVISNCSMVTSFLNTSYIHQLVISLWNIYKVL